MGSPRDDALGGDFVDVVLDDEGQDLEPTTKLMVPFIAAGFDYSYEYFLKDVPNVDLTLKFIGPQNHTLLHEAFIRKDVSTIQSIFAKYDKLQLEDALCTLTDSGENVLHLLCSPKYEDPIKDKLCLDAIAVHLKESVRSPIMKTVEGGESILMLLIKRTDFALLTHLLPLLKPTVIKYLMTSSTDMNKNWLHVAVEANKKDWQIRFLWTYLAKENQERIFLQQDRFALMPLEYAFTSEAILISDSGLPKLLDYFGSTTDDQHHFKIKSYKSCNQTGISLINQCSSELTKFLDRFFDEKDVLLVEIKVFFLKLFNPLLYQNIMDKLNLNKRENKKYLDKLNNNDFLEEFAKIFIYNFLSQHLYSIEAPHVELAEDFLLKCAATGVLIKQCVDGENMPWIVLTYLFSGDSHVMKKLDTGLQKAGPNYVYFYRESSFTAALFKKEDQLLLKSGEEQKSILPAKRLKPGSAY